MSRPTPREVARVMMERFTLAHNAITCAVKEEREHYEARIAELERKLEETERTLVVDAADELGIALERTHISREEVRRVLRAAAKELDEAAYGDDGHAHAAHLFVSAASEFDIDLEGE